MRIKSGAKMQKSQKQGKSKSIQQRAEEPVKNAKKTANPLQSTPIGNSQMKFDPAKKPKAITTDRGIFGIK